MDNQNADSIQQPCSKRLQDPPKLPQKPDISAACYKIDRSCDSGGPPKLVAVKTSTPSSLKGQNEDSCTKK